MRLDYRLQKQIIIASVFLGIILVLIYFLFIRPATSPNVLCFNNKKDNKEEGVDCGGICKKPCLVIKPLKIVSKKLFKIENFDYDFLVIIQNPNFDLGGDEINYELELFNKEDQIIDVKKGSFFIMPGQTRYEIISPIKTNQEIYRAEFKIGNPKWEKLKEFISQPIFSLKYQEYLPPSGEDSPRLKGVLTNNSSFSFNKTDVYVVLYDNNNVPIAVNKTNIHTFLSQTDRFFEVRWLRPFIGEVNRIDVQAYTNVFQNDNFFREKNDQEEFQKF